MQLRSVLLCLALLCATVLAETHVIGGAFSSLGSKRATNIAVWDHTSPQWLDLHSAVDRIAITDPHLVAVSDAGDLFWVGSDNNIERYSFVAGEAATTSPLYRVRMGGQEGVIIGNIQAIQVSADGASLYVCGQITDIGTTIDDADGLARIYQITIANNYEFSDIVERSPTNTPVDCSSFLVLNDRLLVIDSLGNLQQASVAGDPWGIISTAGTAIERDAAGHPLIRAYSGGIYAYGTSLSGTPFNPTFLRTIQAHADGGADTAWTSVVGATAMTNYTVSYFVVGGTDEVYATVTSGNAPEDVFYVQASTGGGNPLVRIAPSYIFTADLSLNEASGFNIQWDSNLNTLVAYGSTLNYVTYAPENLRGDLANYETFYSKPIARVARFIAPASLDDPAGFWQPAYGGGFSAAPVHIRAVNGHTIAFGSFTFTFDNYTGPVAIFDDDSNTWGVFDDAIDTNSGFSQIDFDPSVAGVGEINAIVHSDDFGVIVAGRFRTVGNGLTPVHSITSFGGDDLGAALGSGFDVGVRVSSDNTFETTNSVPGTIHDVLVHDGYIYVVGSFDLAGAISVNNVARYNTESNQWEDLLGGANGVVYALREFDDKIIIGGSFDFVGSTTRANNIAAFNPDEGRWETLNTGVDGPVYVLHSFDDDDYLIAGGAFTSASGVNVQRASLAAWDGKNWHSLSALIDDLDNDDCYTRICPTGAPATVTDILNYEDEQLLFVAGNTVHSFSEGGFTTGAFLAGINVFSAPGVRSLVQSLDDWHDSDDDVVAAWNAVGTASSGALRTDFHAHYENLLYTRAGVNNYVHATWPDNVPEHGDGGKWKIIVGVILGVVGLILIIAAIVYLRKSGRLRNAKFWKRSADADERQYRVEESQRASREERHGDEGGRRY